MNIFSSFANVSLSILLIVSAGCQRQDHAATALERPLTAPVDRQPPGPVARQSDEELLQVWRATNSLPAERLEVIAKLIPEGASRAQVEHILGKATSSERGSGRELHFSWNGFEGTNAEPGQIHDEVVSSYEFSNGDIICLRFDLTGVHSWNDARFIEARERPTNRK